MKNPIFIIFSLFIFGCVSEEESWQYALDSNSYDSYNYFLTHYPNGKFSSEARTKLQNCANVVVEVSDDHIKSCPSFRNIAGPVWIFTPKFKEVNGIAASITTVTMKIYAQKGVYESIEKNIIGITPLDQRKVVIVLSAKGMDSYTTWVSGKDLIGSKMQLTYSGRDINEHPILLHIVLWLDE